MIQQLPLLKQHQLKAALGKSFHRRRQVAVVLHLGGGVQSSTLAYMAAEGLIDVDLVLFADTGDEPFWVYQTVGNVRTALGRRGIPLVMTVRECNYNGWFVTSAGPRGSMPVWVKMPGQEKPGRLRRQCTNELKVVPNERYLRLWLAQQNVIRLPSPYHLQDGVLWEGHSRIYDHREWPRMPIPNDVYVESLFGISTDEPLRAKERGPRWQKTRYPLIEMGMSRVDCVTWLQEHGYPVPSKSACFQCPYRDDASWLWMKENHPAVFAEACRYDDWLRTPDAKRAGAYAAIRGEMYLHRSCVPLRAVDFAALIAAAHRSSSSEFEKELLVTCSADGGFSCMS